MSAHFGMAKWMLVADGDKGSQQFVRNEGLNGSSMAALAIGQGCTDVVVLDIGDGALRHLQAAGIRIWAAPGTMTGQQALELLARGELAPVQTAHAETSHAGHGGCCCGGHGASRCCSS